MTKIFTGNEQDVWDLLESFAIFQGVDPNSKEILQVKVLFEQIKIKKSENRHMLLDQFIVPHQSCPDKASVLDFCFSRQDGETGQFKPSFAG